MLADDSSCGMTIYAARTFLFWYRTYVTPEDAVAPFWYSPFIQRASNLIHLLRFHHYHMVVHRARNEA